MNLAARATGAENPALPDLLRLCAASSDAAQALLAVAKERLGKRVRSDGRVSNKALEADQSAAHALSWMATYVESLAQMLAWAQRLEAEGGFGEMERLILQIAFGEYLWQLYGGIPMSQGEIARPQDIGLSQDEQRLLMVPEVTVLTGSGNTDAARARLVALMIEREGAATFGNCGLDGDYEMIREMFRRFADDRESGINNRL